MVHRNNLHCINQVSAILHISYYNNRSKVCSDFPPVSLHVSVLMHRFNLPHQFVLLKEVQNPFFMYIDSQLYPSFAVMGFTVVALDSLQWSSQTGHIHFVHVFPGESQKPRFILDFKPLNYEVLFDNSVNLDLITWTS